MLFQSPTIRQLSGKRGGIPELSRGCRSRGRGQKPQTEGPTAHTRPHPTSGGVLFARLRKDTGTARAYSASKGQTGSSLAYSQTMSLTMNLDVRWRRHRSKLTLIKSSQPTLRNTIISKFGQASHTARPAQQGMSQSTEGDPDRRGFQFEMSLWEG